MTTKSVLAMLFLLASPLGVREVRAQQGSSPLDILKSVAATSAHGDIKPVWVVSPLAVRSYESGRRLRLIGPRRNAERPSTRLALSSMAPEVEGDRNGQSWHCITIVEIPADDGPEARLIGPELCERIQAPGCSFGWGLSGPLPLSHPERALDEILIGDPCADNDRGCVWRTDIDSKIFERVDLPAACQRPMQWLGTAVEVGARPGGMVIWAGAPSLPGEGSNSLNPPKACVVSWAYPEMQGGHVAEGSLGFGRLLAATSDKDGDGWDDAAVTGTWRGLPEAEAPAGRHVRVGRLALMSGKTGALLWDRESAEWTTAGAMAWAADFDSDGASDLLVAESRNEDSLTAPAPSGQVVIVSGRTGDILKIIRPPEGLTGFGASLDTWPLRDETGASTDLVAVGYHETGADQRQHSGVILYRGDAWEEVARLQLVSSDAHVGVDVLLFATDPESRNLYVCTTVIDQRPSDHERLLVYRLRP